MKLDIDTEIDAIETAYKLLCEQKDKTRNTTDDFEKAIMMFLYPQKSVKPLTEMNLIERFSKYNDDGLRDGNFGEGSPLVAVMVARPKRTLAQARMLAN